MALIRVLDEETIDKIAAGEVVERPASVVKELVENAIDAGADAVTVEVKDGGISLIRVTDNGCGMERDQLRTAFLRHATSKITDAEDLARISSLGFRGEALSSIAAVSRSEVVTKTRESLTGSRILLEGAAEMAFEEVGAPDGTTFLVRNLFFNTPVRRKFLKQPPTEGGYVADLMEHLALSRPDISFKFLLGAQLKFHTSGNGDLQEVIYRLYGREVASALVPIRAERDGMKIEGYLGTPEAVRSNRNFEIYFLNGRFVRSNLVAKAIEEGYREYLMQHKFPLCVLHLAIDTSQVDVNVHPTKMDVRFSDGMAVAGFLTEAVRRTLQSREMIPQASLSPDRERKARERTERKEQEKRRTPEPFETKRSESYRVQEETKFAAVSLPKPSKVQDLLQNMPKTGENPRTLAEKEAQKEENPASAAIQQDLFEEKLLTPDNRARFRVIGQVFETYWLVQFEDKLLLIDQHAAHEKVHYERLMKQFHEKKVAVQGLLPPIIVTLSAQEEQALKEHWEVFAGLGFEIEAFGGSEYALRGVPVDLYGCGEREMFLEALDQLGEGGSFGGIRVVEEKIASMSCKAAVKGRQLLSLPEAETLIDELLGLENPYNCPHGRPTIISLSRYELERKFKRVVS